MTEKKLTARQKQILKFISEFIENNRFPPTRSELAAHFGFRSPNAAESHLRALESKSVIAIERGAARGIALLPLAADELPAAANLPLPLIGRVAAGSPILAEAHVQARYQLDPNLFTPRADYLLRVRGLSMRDAGILDGDLLAVHRTQEARSGQIVVARLADEVTVKRFRRRGYSVQLVPENDDFEPIELDLREDELAIEGIGVGVIRQGRSL